MTAHSSPLWFETHKRGYCQLLTEGRWFTPRENQLLKWGNRSGRAVARPHLSIGRPGFDTRSWLPHIIHLFILYIHHIHHHPSDRDVTWRARVSELYSGHVKESWWLWWNSMSQCIRILSYLCFLCIHDTCVNIMTCIAYIYCWKVVKLQFLLYFKGGL